MSAAVRIKKLQRAHNVESFDCGKEALNRFLIRFAWQNQQAGASQTYVGLSGEEVVGFYSLVVGQVEYADAPVPIMLLARFAVRFDWQGKRIGSGLLKDAMLRTLQAADIAGIRAFAVHARDEQARVFYERFDLVASPTDSFHLFILLKDVSVALQKE